MDEMVPHPTIVSHHVESCTGKIRKCLALEMKSMMDEKFIVAIATNVTIEDCSKISYFDLTSHYADSG